MGLNPSRLSKHVCKVTDFLLLLSWRSTLHIELAHGIVVAVDNVSVLLYCSILFRLIKPKKLDCTSRLGLSKPFPIAATVNSKQHSSDLGSFTVGTHQMKSPTGAWLWARGTIMQLNCWNLFKSGWIPSQFYKWKTLDFGSAQNVQCRYHPLVTPSVPASGSLLLVIQPLSVVNECLHKHSEEWECLNFNTSKSF